MKSFNALLVAAFLLSGCGLVAAQRQQAAFRQAEGIAEECRQKRLAGQLKGYLASIQCSNDRMRQVIVSSGYPHRDLVDLYLAQRQVLAEKLDAGEISESQAQLSDAELRTRIASEEQRRNAQAQQTQLQANQAWQNSLNMLNYNLQQQQNRDALMSSRPTAPVICQNMGTYVWCH